MDDATFIERLLALRPVIDGRLAHKAHILDGRLHISCRLPPMRGPDGSVHTFFNVADFAREHGLHRSSICKVISGRLQSTGGWSRADNNKSRDKQLCAPDGTLHTVEPTLTAFCKKHGLQAPNVCGLRKGLIKQHKGWTVPS